MDCFIFIIFFYMVITTVIILINVFIEVVKYRKDDSLTELEELELVEHF